MASNLDYLYRLRDQYSKKLEKIIYTSVKFEKTYRKSMGKINASIKHNIQKVREQAETHKRSNRVIVGGAAKLAQLTRKTNEYNRSALQIRKATVAWEKHSKAINKNSAALSKNKRRIDGVNRLKNKSRNMFGKGVQNLAVGTVGLAILNTPVEIARSYQLAFKDVRKSVVGSEAELQSLRQQMKDFKGASFEDLALIVSDVGKMGVDATKAMDVAAIIQKGAKALDFMPDEAVDQIGKILTMTNQLDKPVKASLKIIDSVTHLENTLSAVKAKDILNVWKRTSAVMSGLKFDHDQMAGMSAALVQLGISPEIAASGFRSLINQFKGSKLGRGFLDKLRKEGPEGLTDIIATMSKMGEEARLKLTGKFGGDLVDKLLIKKNMDKIFVAIKVSEGSQGAMEREWVLFRNTYDERVKDFKKSFRNNMDVIGKTIIPLITKIITFITPIIKSVGKWVESNQNLVRIIAAVVIGALGIITILGVLQITIAAVGFAMGGFLSILTAIAFIVKVVRIAFLAFQIVIWLVNAAMFANPIGLIILLVVGLIAIIVLARVRLKSWGAAFKFFGQLILKAVLQRINLIIGAIRLLLKAASYLPGAMGKAAKGGYEALTAMQDKINIKLTGNKSLTAAGMIYDLAREKGPYAPQEVSQATEKTARGTRQRVDTSITGDIRVSAEPGSKVTKQEWSMFNQGQNMAPAF